MARFSASVSHVTHIKLFPVPKTCQSLSFFRVCIYCSIWNNLSLANRSVPVIFTCLFPSQIYHFLLIYYLYLQVKCKFHGIGNLLAYLSLTVYSGLWNMRNKCGWMNGWIEGWMDEWMDDRFC